MTTLKYYEQTSHSCPLTWGTWEELSLAYTRLVEIYKRKQSDICSSQISTQVIFTIIYLQIVLVQYRTDRNFMIWMN